MRKKIMTKFEVRVTQIYRDYYHIEAKDEDEAKSLIRQHVIEEDSFIDAKKVNTHKHPFPNVDYAVEIDLEGNPII